MLNSFKTYFNFSKKELNGILILCVLIFIVVIAPAVYSILYRPERVDFAGFDKEIAKFYASEKSLSTDRYMKIRDELEENELVPEYFSFDPNNLPVNSWKRLGLSDRQIKIIRNYQSKGGKFFKKEDLKKIYSISAQDYARLEPYIEISNSSPQKRFKNLVKTYERRATASTIKIIDINSADSAQLESLRGIGPAFASRIIRYRNRLGGFYSKEQLREVYGIDSVKYAALKDQVTADASAIQKININTAVFEDLKRHPYLSYKQMNAIIQYRNQHGKFNRATDLQKIVILNEEILRKIGPYLVF